MTRRNCPGKWLLRVTHLQGRGRAHTRWQGGAFPRRTNGANSTRGSWKPAVPRGRVSDLERCSWASPGDWGHQEQRPGRPVVRVIGASEREPQEGGGRLAFSLCLQHLGQQPAHAHSRCLVNTSRVTESYVQGVLRLFRTGQAPRPPSERVGGKEVRPRQRTVAPTQRPNRTLGFPCQPGV